MSFSYLSHGGALILLWLVRSGVLQGCPLSGLLFSIAMDPFACAFDRLQQRLNTQRLNVCVRLCADDVGAAIAKIDMLKSFHIVFQKAEALSGLTLKSAKCILVPLFDRNFEMIERQVKAWLRKHIPCWEHFSVKTAATFLGFAMGPKANEIQLTKTKQKWLLT